MSQISVWDEAREKILSDELGVIGRENQITEIKEFLLNQFRGDSKQFLFLTGIPGTGKTASLLHSISIIKQEVDFDLCMVNAMEFEKPSQVFMQIAQYVYNNAKNKNSMVRSSGLRKRLETNFLRKGRQRPILLFIDEVEHIVSGDFTAITSLITWSTAKNSRLFLVGIANLVDLPERLNAHLGQISMKRIIFNSYSSAEIVSILKHRLGTHVSLFKSPAVFQFIGSKVSKTKGDARLAFELCLQAINSAESDALKCTDEMARNDVKVTIEHVNIGSNRLRSIPEIQSIQYCTIHEKLLIISVILCIVYNENVSEVTGSVQSEEVRFNVVRDRFFQMCEMYNVTPKLNYHQYGLALSNLSQLNIIEFDDKSHIENRIVRLDIDLDDFIYEIESNETNNKIFVDIINSNNLKDYIDKF